MRTSLFTAASFIITKYCKQSKGPCTQDLLNNLQYINTMAYHTSVNKTKQKDNEDLYDLI